MSILPVACTTTHPLPGNLQLALALLKTDHLLRALKKSSWLGGNLKIHQTQAQPLTSQLGLQRGLFSGPATSNLQRHRPYISSLHEKQPPEAHNYAVRRRGDGRAEGLLEGPVHVQGKIEGDGKLEPQAV